MSYGCDVIPLTDKEFIEYLAEVPIALGLERLTELELMRSKPMQSPVLDFGIGDGIFSRAIFRDRSPAVGVDFSFRELLYMNKSRKPIPHRVCADGRKLPFRDNYFATAVSNSVLEHIEHLGDVLSELRRVLRDDAWLYLTVPSNKFEQYSIAAQLFTLLKLPKTSNAYRRWYNRFWKHYHAYDALDWARFFEQHGFTVEEAVGYNSRFSCAVNESLAPLGLFGKMRRQSGKPWVSSISLRKRVLRPLLPLFKNHVRYSFNGDGLLFFSLKKIR